MLQSSLFNSSCGYLDALFRTNKSRLITREKLEISTECNSLEDFRLLLSSFSAEYGKGLENIPKLLPTAIYSKCMEILQDEINYLLVQNTDKQIFELVNYFKIPFMIDNASLLLRYAVSHESAAGLFDEQTVLDYDLGTDDNDEGKNEQILAKCHPLGLFDSLCMLRGPESVFKDVYYEILMESPLQKYLTEASMVEKLDNVQTIEIFINVLYHFFLDDFFLYCQNNLSGYARDKMMEYVRLEADLRVLNISINSLNAKNISIEDRLSMFPTISSSFSSVGLSSLSVATSTEQIKQIILSEHPHYAELFNTHVDIDVWFIERELEALEQVFVDSFTGAIFFAYFKQKEQEIKNIYWVSECIAQGQPKEIYQKHVL